MIVMLGDKLREISLQECSEVDNVVVIITTLEKAEDVFKDINIDFAEEFEKRTIAFNKIEAYQKCVVGTLFVPRVLPETNERYSMHFYIDKGCIVIVDDDDFAEELIQRIMKKKSHQGESKGNFIFNFFAEFMSKDIEVLTQYEKMLMDIEENIMNEKVGDYQSELSPIRKKLLLLRGYYGEIADMGKELEANEIDLFNEDEIVYFGIISDRAERLMVKTAHILEYASQVREAYQTQAAKEQSSNMQFLTVISTIFFPLTLITGWFGMNFRNMPELANGYPGVIVLSLIVVIVCVVIFKKKRIF